MFSYFTSKYSISQLKSIGLELPSNWNRTSDGMYEYNPKDKELVDILKNDRLIEIQKRMKLQKYGVQDGEDDRDEDGDEDDEEDKDDKDDKDIDMVDNYGYLLEYMKESTGQNDILTRLREMEDKFDKVSKQYTKSCGSGKYPTALNKSELIAIKNREENINKMNKASLFIKLKMKYIFIKMKMY